MTIQGEATVVKHTGSHYMLAQLPQWNLFPAVLRGKIRLKGSTATNPVAVGDRVTFSADVPDDAQNPMEFLTAENPAAITAVHPRKNYIIRKSTNLSRQSHIIAANLDRAFIIATIDFPEIKLPFLDRLLVTCEVYNVPVTIVLNKVDLYRESHAEMLEAFHEIYEGAGYPIIEVSALTGEGVDTLREACNGHVSLFSGVSGVGKSSLIKALDPSLDPKVGEISDVHLQGKHTTTFYEMYSLASGGFIVDTPGLRGFGLVDLGFGVAGLSHIDAEGILPPYHSQMSPADDHAVEFVAVAVEQNAWSQSLADKLCIIEYIDFLFHVATILVFILKKTSDYFTSYDQKSS